MLIRDQFYPKLILSGQADKVFQGWLLSSLCVLAMGALLFIFLDSARKWLKAGGGSEPAPQAAE